MQILLNKQWSPILSRALHSTSSMQQQHTVDQVISYHNRTKHSLSSGYARGPHGLDWANQPNQFLSFSSPFPSIPLLHFPNDESPLYSSLLSSPLPPPCHVDLPSLSRLLYDSLSLSAWKSTSLSTWPLRVNPSSGNLHPTESHLITNSLSTPLLAHYSPKHHSLFPRAHLPVPVGPTSPLLLLSSIFWREAWKYGERALRYCNHDIGHAIAAVAISAAALGWDVRLLDSLAHADLEKILGIHIAYPHPQDHLPDRPATGVFPWIEAQYPDCLLCIFPFGENSQLDCSFLEKIDFGNLEWKGKPEPLSKDHVYWDVIYRTADLIKKPCTQEIFVDVPPFRQSGMISEKLYKGYTVREVVRMRRSAVDMDGSHVMGRDTFYQILLRCLPSGEVESGEGQGKQMAVPFRVLTWDAEVHAAIFVHSVEGLAKGVYFLVRNEGHLERLKLSMRADFEWARPEGCPDGLPLYRLASGNCKRLAKVLSCHQVLSLM